MRGRASEHYRGAATVIIKVGSNVLTDPERGANAVAIKNIVKGIQRYRQDGKQVILVSSGAVGCGRTKSGFTKKRSSVPEKQALSAIGQIQLMQIYADAFAKKGLSAAQILLSRSSLKDRNQYHNLSNCFDQLFKLGVIPIVNENDALATEELSIGDNDAIASLIATRVGADLLILLTTVDGLLDSQGQIITELHEVKIDEHDFNSVGATSSFGTGGMQAKLDAAKLSASNGIPVIIASGHKKMILQEIADDKAEGTFIHPRGTKLRGKKSWILAASSDKRGYLEIDSGAAHALLSQGKSLLPAGVKKIHGSFNAGDVIKVHQGKSCVAVGISNFDHRDAARVAGKHSKEISKLLGETLYNEIIHRDNLVILER